MKRFMFKLQPVLNLRSSVEEQIQIKLAEALNRLSEAECRLDEMIIYKERLSEDLEKIKKKPLCVEDLILYQRHIESTEIQIESQKSTVQAIGIEVESIRDELLHAAREKKIMEKIKDKQKIRYMQNAQKLEIDFLDEIGTIRSARQTNDNCH